MRGRMTPFRLEVSDHAALRLSQRGISRQIIRQCVATGILENLDVGGRLVKALRIRQRILVVVYLEVRGGALVVTAYWKG